MTHALRSPRRADNTNRVIKGNRDHQDWVAYRFAHANMRLRDRYGVEMTREKFEYLSANFSNVAQDIRKNGRGDFEGWVEVQAGIWACAAYKPSQGLIGTFFPCPPPRLGRSAKSTPDTDDALEKMTARARGAERELSKAASRVAELERGPRQQPPTPNASKPLDEPERAELARLRRITIGPGSYANVHRWTRRRLSVVAELLKEGRSVAALLLADGLASIPGKMSDFEASAEASLDQREAVLVERMVDRAVNCGMTIDDFREALDQYRACFSEDIVKPPKIRVSERDYQAHMRAPTEASAA